MTCLRDKTLCVWLQVLSYILLITAPCLADISILNDKIIGNDIESSINLTNSVKNSNANNIKPIRIVVNIENGKYVGAMVYYSSNELSFVSIEEILDKYYPELRDIKVCSEKFKTWRVTERKFGVSLFQEDCGEKDIVVAYWIFREYF